jgi:type III secretory pathway component EscT
MVTIKEIKSTVAVAIAAAFGFVIALLWKDIIVGLLQMTPFWKTTGFTDAVGAAVAVVTVLIITIICVIGIIYISKWGGVGQK